MITNYTVTVKFGCTQSVVNYSNVRPEFEMSLSGQGDAQEASDIADKLLDDVRQSIQEIVDQELELRDQDLLYYHGPTFSLVNPKDFVFLAIVPDSQPLPKLWGECVPYHMSHKRIEWLRWLIKNKYQGDSLYDYANVPIVDVHDLPLLEKFTELRMIIEGIPYLILLSGERRYFGTGDNNISPGPPQAYYRLDHDTSIYVMDKERFLVRMFAIAENKGFTLIDCLDNDFSRLPRLPDLPEPKPEEEKPDDFEDEEEYEDDDDDEDIP